MMYVKLSRNGRYGKKGDPVQVTDVIGKGMIEDKVAVECDAPKRRARRVSIDNKAISAAG